MKRGIRSRLILAQFALVLAVLVAVGGVLSWGLQRLYLGLLEDHLAGEAAAMAEMLPATAPLDGGLARRLAHDTATRLTLIAADGTVLADSEHDPATMENHRLRPEVGVALAGGRGVSLRRSDTLVEDMLYVTVPLRRAEGIVGVVRLALPLAEVRAAQGRLALIVFGTGLAVLLLAIPVVLRLSRRLTGPLEAMTEAAGAMAAGDLTRRVLPDGEDEIATLGRALNHLAAKVETQVADLADSRDRLGAVLTAMASAVLFIEGDGRVTYANAAAQGLFRDAAGGGHHVAVLRNYPLSAAIDQVLGSGQAAVLSLQLTHPRPAWLAATLTPLRQGGRGVVAVLHDVSQARRVEQMRRDFVANVSHELKTPVTAVQGFAETLLGGALDDPEARRQFVTIIHAEAGRMAALIGDLLELAKLEAEPDAVRPEPVALAALLGPALARLRPRAEQAGVALAVGPLPTVVVQADARRIDQVLVNLVENSLAYTPAGGRILVTAEIGHSEVKISVADTGQGIPAEALGRIFERFYRADRGRSRKQGGTGLGLAIVKHIVEAQGGRVGASSDEGRGATVWFTLPLGA